jgi:hypothetical protein
MKVKSIILVCSFTLVLVFLSCGGGKKASFEETVSKEVDVLSAKMEDTDMELASIQKYVDAMKRDIDLDLEKIEDSVKRISTAQAAIKQSINTLKGEQRRLHEEQGGLPFLAKFIIIVVIIILFIIAFKIYRTRSKEEEEKGFGEMKGEEESRGD